MTPKKLPFLFRLEINLKFLCKDSNSLLNVQFSMSEYCGLLQYPCG